MGLLTDSRASAAFKLSQRRAHTHNNRQFFNESFESSYVVLAQDIWANQLPTDPAQAITDGLVAPVTLRLYNILSPDASPVVNSYKAVFFWGDQSASTQSLLAGKINHRSKTLFSDATFNSGLATFGNGSEGTDINGGARIGHIIPEIINAADSDLANPGAGGYKPILKNASGTRIFPLDSSDWFLDTFAGILTHETDGPILNLNGNNSNANATQHAELECFVYIGSMVSDVVGNSGGGGGGNVTQVDLNNLQSLLAGQIDANTSLIQPITADVVDIRSDITALSAAIGGIDVSQQISSGTSALSAALQAEIDAVESRVGTLEDTTLSQTAAISANTDDIAQAKSDIDAAELNIQGHSTDISTLQSQTADISGNFADLRTENIFQENGTFLKDLTVVGSLNVAASAAVIVQSNTVETSANFITLNDGQVGSSVTKGEAGILVDRGTADAAVIRFDEIDDTWKVGISGTDNAIATRDSSTATPNALVFGADTENYTQDANFTYDGSNVAISGDNLVKTSELDIAVSTLDSSILSLSGSIQSQISSEFASNNALLSSISGGLQSSIDSNYVMLTSNAADIQANQALVSSVSGSLYSLIASTSGQGGGGGDVDTSALQAVSGSLQTQIDDLSTSIVAGASGVIGAAEDGNYNDGLFQDFTPTTPIGTAVDRFNELFLAIAPSPPPTMDNISLTGLSKESGRISYGTDNDLVGYRETGVGTKNTVVNNLIASTSTFSGVINQDVSSNSSHPADVFGNAKSGLLRLMVDGVELATLDLEQGDGAIDNTSGGTVTGISVSAVGFAELNGTALTADLFAYRTGTFTILASDFPTGENFGYHTVQVIHTDGGTSNTDTFNIDADVQAMSFSGQGLSNLVLPTTKHISGIEYATSGTVDFDGGSAFNVYRNSYSNNSNAISWIGTNINSQNDSLPLLGAGEEEDHTLVGADLDKAGMVINPSNNRLLKEDIQVMLQIKKPLGRTATATPVSISNILFDAVSPNSSDLNENFNDEDYRLINDNLGTYGDQNDWSSGGLGGRNSSAVWDSTNALGTGDEADGLLICNSRLSYPDYTNDLPQVTNGDFSGGGVVPSPGPNYSSLNGDRTFLRYFYFGDSANVSNFSFNVSSSPSLTLVAANAVFGGSTEYKVEILVPGEAITPQPTPVLQWNDAFRDWGDENGIYNASNSSGNWRSVTLGTVGCKVVVFRITVPDNFIGRITRLQVKAD